MHDFLMKYQTEEKNAVDILDNVGRIYILFKNATTVMEFQAKTTTNGIML